MRTRNTDLVSVVGLIGEAEGHAEGAVVLLQEGVSVSPLVHSGHDVLELLQPGAKVLLSPRPTGEVRLHHLAQREVVPRICTLMKVQTLLT